ncbi:TetR family transcriptional regulator [Streptomyces sp. NPDC002851]
MAGAPYASFARRSSSPPAGGYRRTSTEAIAKHAGVCQPYLFRLFKNNSACSRTS